MGKRDDIYKQVEEAGSPPIGKQVKLVNKTFTILELSLETFKGEDEDEPRDFYVALIRLNGKEGHFYLAGVRVMDQLEVLTGLKDGLPSDWTLVKVKSAKGQRYDLQRPAAGELFDAEQGEADDGKV